MPILCVDVATHNAIILLCCHFTIESYIDGIMLLVFICIFLIINIVIIMNN